MERFILVDAADRAFGYLAFVAGLALLAVVLWLLGKRWSAGPDARSGWERASWPMAIGVAAVPIALGVGFLTLPFASPHYAVLDDERLTLEYAWPAGAVIRPRADVRSVVLVESCVVLRSGWRTRSLLEVALARDPIPAIEGRHDDLVRLAERLAEERGLTPGYEVRNAALANGACETGSPW